MKIIIDEQNVDIKLSTGKSLEELLLTVQEYLRKKDSSKLIIDVKIDGEEAFNQNYEIKEFNVDKIKTLEIKTDNIRTTALRGLEEIKNILPKLSSSMSNISTTLQTGNKEGALAAFSNLCSEWRKIIQFFDNLSQLLGVNYADLKVEDKSIDQINEELISLLINTKTHIEKDDLVMLSDLIEYELAPKIDQQIQIVESIVDYIKK